MDGTEGEVGAGSPDVVGRVIRRKVFHGSLHIEGAEKGGGETAVLKSQSAGAVVVAGFQTDPMGLCHVPPGRGEVCLGTEFSRMGVVGKGKGGIQFS